MGPSSVRNPILDVPLSKVMQPQFALPLQHLLKLYTVGSFLHAWANPNNQRSIEQVFDSPQQAQHAAAVCAAWLGVRSGFIPLPAPPRAWWVSDDPMPVAA